MRITKTLVVAAAMFLTASTTNYAQTTTAKPAPRPITSAPAPAKATTPTVRRAAVAPAPKPVEVPKSEAIRNTEEVITMINGGVPEDRVITWINREPRKEFDTTSSTAMIALAKINDKIINAMEGKLPAPVAVVPPAPVVAAVTPAPVLQPDSTTTKAEPKNENKGSRFNPLNYLGRGDQKESGTQQSPVRSTSGKSSFDKLDKGEIKKAKAVEFTVNASEKSVYDGILAHYRRTNDWTVQSPSFENGQIIALLAQNAMGFSVEIQTVIKFFNEGNATMVRVSTSRRRKETRATAWPNFGFEADRSIETAKDIETSLNASQGSH